MSKAVKVIGYIYISEIYLILFRGDEYGVVELADRANAQSLTVMRAKF